MGANEAYVAVTEMCNIKHVLVGILPTPGIEF